MKTNRLEAFSDGVMAIIITVMVLELKAPQGPEWAALRPLLPILASYVMSFVYVGIYWNNHHHMLQLTDSINGWTLLANLHLLFWLSLIPFVTAWMGGNGFAEVPTFLYGCVLLLASLAWHLLQYSLIRGEPRDSLLRDAIGHDVKGKASAGVYAVALGLACVRPWIAIALYSLVALAWLIPDRRFEKTLTKRGATNSNG